jgi:hypothetical protein
MPPGRVRRRSPAARGTVVSGARRALALAVLEVWAFCVLPSAIADASAGVGIRASFSPDRLGASSAVTFGFRFSESEEAVPQPLTGLVVHLPAGLGTSLRSVPICSKTRLQSHGPSGCPSRSLLGRGSATIEVRPGSQTLPEQVEMSALRGPNHGNRPTLEIFGQGETPLYESTISTAVLEPDGAPYGSKLAISIPPIPTLVLEPNASFQSFSLTIGGAGRGGQAHAPSAITVPRRCPSGGFPFAASFTFADHSTASASTAVPCP